MGVGVGVGVGVVVGVDVRTTRVLDPSKKFGWAQHDATNLNARLVGWGAGREDNDAGGEGSLASLE